MKAGGWGVLMAVTWVAMLLLAGLDAGAAVGPSNPSRASYSLTRWTTDHSLPHNSVRCLLQARDGCLWIGTEEGLVRYDGFRFTVFDKANTRALRSAHVVALAEDGEGGVWAGTSNGLLEFRHGRVDFHATGTNAPQNMVRSLCAGGDGRLWIGTRSGVTAWSPASAAAPSGPEPAGRTYYSLIEDNARRVWSFTTVGVLRWEPSSNAWTHLLSAPAFPMPNAEGPLLSDHAGASWFGFQNGLWRWRGGLLERFSATNGLPEGTVTALAGDVQGGLWIGMHEGKLVRFADGRFTDMTAICEPRSGIHCLLMDREGALWIGTHRSGLVRLLPARLTTIATPDERVWSIAESTRGDLWLGMTYFVSRMEGGSFTNHYRSGYNVALPDRTGQIWAASNEGLFRMKDGSLERQSFPGGASNLTTLFLDRSGALWATGRGALHRHRDGAWQHFPVPAVMAAAELGGLVEDHSGTLWVGSAGRGVLKFQDGSFVSLGASNGLTSDVAAPLLAEADGTLWVGSDRGLNRLKGGRIARVTTADGLPENHILNLLDDGTGWFWTIGYRGIHRLRISELNDFAEGRARLIHSVDYGVADGMRHPQGNIGRFPNTCRTSDGRLWFPTIQGAVVVDPGALSTNPPVVLIEEVLVDGLPVLGDDTRAGPGTRTKPEGRRPELPLAPGRHQVVQFRFSAPVLNGSEKVRFRYRLSGQDNDWIEQEPGRERVATYANLQPGRYRFEVLAANRDGFWSPHPAALALVIPPRFHQTAAFYGLCALGIVGLAAGIQGYRLRMQREFLRLRHEADLERERTRLARDLHDQLGSGLARISVLGELASREIRLRGSPSPHLEKIAAATRELLGGVSEIVWATHPGNDNLESLAAYFARHAQEFLQPAGLAVRFHIPPDLPELRLSSDARHHLFLAFKETLANILKHARATEVHLRFSVEKSVFRLCIEDNGGGFEVPGVNSQITRGGGNGLPNLRARLQALGGHCEVTSCPGQGVSVTMTLPLPPS